MRGGENGGGHDGPANFGRRRRRSAREGERESAIETEGEGVDGARQREKREGRNEMIMYLFII